MWCLLFVLFMSHDATAKEPVKSKTQLYEQEETVEKSKSFTSKVRVVRDISDDVEVFFESDEAKGAYTLPRNAQNYGTMFKNLEKSKGPKGPPVSVTADSEKRIQSVEINAATPEQDPNKAWEF